MAEKNAISANPKASFLAAAQRPAAASERIRFEENSFSETHETTDPADPGKAREGVAASVSNLRQESRQRKYHGVTIRELHPELRSPTNRR